MRLPRLRFTICNLMIAVVVVAGLLALSINVAVIVIALSLTCFTVIGAQWLVFRRKRHLATFAFGLLATLTNVSYVASCVAPDAYLLIALFLGWLVIVAPTNGALGAAWATLATIEGAVPRRSPPAVWLPVIVLSILPLATLWTVWPLHLGFLAAKPSLERLADQIAAGKTIGFPQPAGLFRVAGSAVDPLSGNVGLVIDPNPNGPTGLVRVRPGTSQNRSGPFGWDDLDVALGWGWEYRQED